MAKTAKGFGEGVQLHSGPNGGALGVGGLFPLPVINPIEARFGISE
jgi:hypothetical protein